jgi:hypothetical protein
MKYMREKHPEVSKQQYQLTLVTPLENKEEDDEEAPESEDSLLTSIMCK